jgi:hypothetical protein
MTGVVFPVGHVFFLRYRIHTGIGVQLIFYLVDTSGIFQGNKAAGGVYLTIPPFTAVIKNAWGYNSNTT